MGSGIDWEDILNAEGEDLADAYEAHTYQSDEYETHTYQSDEYETSRYDYADQSDYCVGTWQGKVVRFKKTFSNHTFTDEECAKLLADEVIEFPATTKAGKRYTAKGKLQYVTRRGRTSVEFDFVNSEDYCRGIWRGKTVRFKKTISNHTFTDEECAKLLADEVIEFSAAADNGKEYTAKGKLEYVTYKGHPSVCFTLINSKNYCTGTWQGETVRFYKVFYDHTFTDEECAKLLADEVIEFPATTKAGKRYTAKGKLEYFESNGHKYVGFKRLRRQGQ